MESSRTPARQRSLLSDRCDVDVVVVGVGITASTSCIAPREAGCLGVGSRGRWGVVGTGTEPLPRGPVRLVELHVTHTVLAGALETGVAGALRRATIDRAPSLNHVSRFRSRATSDSAPQNHLGLYESPSRNLAWQASDGTEVRAQVLIARPVFSRSVFTDVQALRRSR